MPPAQRVLSEGNISSQHRKDTARILSTMVPCLNAPLVSLCLNYCFGPEEKKESSPRGRRLSSRSSSPLPSTKLGGSSSFSVGMSSPEPSRFKLRRMDSGPLGEHSLVDPLPGSKDKYGFTNRAESFTFSLAL